MLKNKLSEPTWILLEGASTQVKIYKSIGTDKKLFKIYGIKDKASYMIYQETSLEELKKMKEALNEIQRQFQ